MKQTNISFHRWSVSFVSFVIKQDETDQKPWSVLVSKQGETKCNNETAIIPSLSFFFYKTHFCFITNETNKIYRENPETG